MRRFVFDIHSGYILPFMGMLSITSEKYTHAAHFPPLQCRSACACVRVSLQLEEHVDEHQ